MPCRQKVLTQLERFVYFNRINISCNQMIGEKVKKLKTAIMFGTIFGIYLFATAFLGMYYNDAKFKVWLLMNIVSLLAIFVIYEPIRALTSVLCKKKLTTSQSKFSKVTLDDLNLPNKKSLENYKNCCNEKFSMFRNKSCDPLSEEKLKKLQERFQQEENFNQIFKDLYMFLVYLLILTILILSSRNTFNFYSHKHIENLLIHPKHHENHFFELSTDRDIREYILKTLIPTIHCDKDFDGTLIQENGWLIGKSARLLGNYTI